MKKLKNKIYFLGTGGGATMVSLQKYSTAGFWVNIEGVDLYFDPGPGALWQIRRAHLSPDDLKAVMVTHNHLDHTSDLNALIESIHYQINKGGFNYKDYVVFFPPDTLECISKYHRQMPGRLIKVKSQGRYKVGRLTIRTTKKLLEKPYYRSSLEVFGYLVSGKKHKFLYLPETMYQKGMFKGLKADLVILNAMKAEGPLYENTVKVINELKPKLVLLRHWVKDSADYGIKKFAAKLSKETKVKIIPLEDGNIFNLEKNKLI